MIEIYTVEAFSKEGYELVYCTTEKEQIDSITLEQFEADVLTVSRWLNGEIIDGYTIDSEE